MVSKQPDLKYSVSVIKHDVVNGQHAEYMLRVVGPENISFHIKDRYSSMRNFQSYLKKQTQANVNLPNFPKKKYFQNLDNNFLKGREKQLENFFNVFLQNKHVARSQLVLVYFEEHCLDIQSQEAIHQLWPYYEKGGQTPKQPQRQQTQNNNQQETSVAANVENQLLQAQGSQPSQSLSPEKMEMNWKQFENDCRKIVQDISNKFIDLGVDDGNNSEQYQEMLEKQKKYNKELNKMEFTFETQNLDLPQANPNKDVPAANMGELSTEADSMGKDLDDVFKIIQTDALKAFESNDICVVHQ